MIHSPDSRCCGCIGLPCPVGRGGQDASLRNGGLAWIVHWVVVVRRWLVSVLGRWWGWRVGVWGRGMILGNRKRRRSIHLTRRRPFVKRSLPTLVPTAPLILSPVSDKKMINYQNNNNN